MNIMILGASSILGQMLGAEFAKENVLILVGRDAAKLQLAKNEAEKHNGGKVLTIEHDLQTGTEGLLKVLKIYDVDLLINAASATSQFKDSEIMPKNVLPYTRVDFIAPIDFVEKLLNIHKEKYTDETPLRVIFLSSWVSGIKNPDRNVYASLKFLQESFLRRIEDLNKRRVKVTVVRIGARFSRGVETRHHKKISSKIFKQYQKKDVIFYGITGRVLAFLYYICPFAMMSLINLSRSIRALK